jgi:hypothetical protein
MNREVQNHAKQKTTTKATLQDALLAAITLGTLGLGSAIYVLGIHLVNW